MGEIRENWLSHKSSRLTKNGRKKQVKACKLLHLDHKLNLKPPYVICTKMNDSYPNNTVETAGSLMTEVSGKMISSADIQPQVPNILEIRSILNTAHARNWVKFFTANDSIVSIWLQKFKSDLNVSVTHFVYRFLFFQISIKIMNDKSLSNILLFLFTSLVFRYGLKKVYLTEFYLFHSIKITGEIIHIFSP